jgi:hypothetical protein
MLEKPGRTTEKWGRTRIYIGEPWFRFERENNELRTYLADQTWSFRMPNNSDRTFCHKFPSQDLSIIVTGKNRET